MFCNLHAFIYVLQLNTKFPNGTARGIGGDQ